LIYVSTSNGQDESHVNIPSPKAPAIIALNKKTGKLVWEDNSVFDKILHGQWSSPTVAKLGGGSALFAGAVVFALLGVCFLFVTIVLGLVALGVPAWLSALIVTVVLFAGAGVLFLAGALMLRLRQGFLPGHGPRRWTVNS
jgi:hypothetical protein